MDVKSKGLLTVVPYGLAALMWIGLCVSEFRSYGQVRFGWVLCAVAWTALFSFESGVTSTKGIAKINTSKGE